MPSGNSIQTCYQLHRLGFTTQFWYQLSLVLNSVHLPLPHMQPFISCMAWYWIPWQYHSHYYQLDLVIYNLELPCTCYQQDIMLPLSPLSLSKNLASSQYHLVYGFWYCLIPTMYPHYMGGIPSGAPRKTALPLPNGCWAYLHTSSQPTKNQKASLGEAVLLER